MDKKTQKTVRKAWKIGILILLLTVILEFFMHPHAAFGIDGTMFFYIWYGFVSCLAIIIVSKFLSFLKRSEDYYKEDDAC